MVCEYGKSKQNARALHEPELIQSVNLFLGFLVQIVARAELIRLFDRNRRIVISGTFESQPLIILNILQMLSIFKNVKNIDSIFESLHKLFESSFLTKLSRGQSGEVTYRWSFSISIIPQKPIILYCILDDTCGIVLYTNVEPKHTIISSIGILKDAILYSIIQECMKLIFGECSSLYQRATMIGNNAVQIIDGGRR